MIPFHRVSGGGNDFLALVEPQLDPRPDQIAAWCRRGVSVGADGVFVLRRAGSGVRMTYWNADGLSAELCLNGTRCAARLAFELAWAADAVEVATGAGPIAARRAGEDRVELDLPPPADGPRHVRLRVGGRALEGWWTRVGVPHLVVPWPGDLGEAPLLALGREVRWHPDFAPQGTNVDLVSFSEDHRMAIRSYERGVEDETLACGTGVLAATAVGLHLELADLPLTALTRGGFELEMRGAVEGGAARSWSQAGDARLVARGVILPAAEVSVRPPEWK